jgi:hypothetical protein
MKVKCKICNREVDEELYEYHYNSEYHLLEKIMERYPAWNSNENKVIWFYRNFVLNDSSQ